MLNDGHPGPVASVAPVVGFTFASRVCLSALVGMAATSAFASQEGEVLASIGEETIDLEDLKSEIATELRAAEFEYNKKHHQLIEATLKKKVRERLLAKFSGDAEVDSVVYLRDEVHAKVSVSDEDVDAFYQQNRARMQERTLEQMAPQIREYLLSDAKARAEVDFYSGLEERYDVSYALEPFRVEIETEGHPSVGPSNAKVTLVEFSDFQCPFCSKFNATLNIIKKKYPEDVRVVFRQFPLAMHADAQKAAEASLCAEAQGKFWQMHDLMFAEQSQLSVDKLKEKAVRLELDSEKFNECLDSAASRDRVLRDVQDGAAFGVSGTPALFINGRPMDGGALPLEAIGEIIDQELKQ